MTGYGMNGWALNGHCIGVGAWGLFQMGQVLHVVLFSFSLLGLFFLLVPSLRSTPYQATYFLRSEWNKVLTIYNTLLVAPPGRDASMSPRFMKPCCRCRVSPHETKSKMQMCPSRLRSTRRTWLHSPSSYPARHVANPPNHPSRNSSSLPVEKPRQHVTLARLATSRHLFTASPPIRK